MYFWKIDQLENDLKKGISEKEDMKYLLIMVFFSTIIMMPLAQNPNMYDYIISVTMCVFATLQVYILYTCNKGDKGSNFLSRYLSTGFVIAIRSIVFLLIPLVVLSIIGLSILDPNGAVENTGVVDVIFMILYLLGYLYMQIQSFKKINS